MATLIEELRTLLNQVCEGRQATSPAAFVQLEDNLVNNKKLLINLLDDLPKKAEHRTTLISGKAVINGKEYRVNEDFVKQSVYISDNLNLDEFTSARLLLEGISQATTVNSTALDTAVYLYHTERNYVLTILNIILEAAKDHSIDQRARFVFTQFMGDLVKEKTSKGSFIKRIIQSTKDISTMTDTLKKNGMLDSGKESKQQLLTQLTPQYQQQAQDGSLAVSIQAMEFRSDTLGLRLEKLNEERISLVQTLYHISSLFWLPEDDLLDILTKVQSINLSDSVASYMLTALLAALSFDGYVRQGEDFSNNDTFLKKLHDQITNKSWKVNILEAVVHIQWALFISNVSRTRSITLSFDKSQFVKAAIASDAFGFMNKYLLYFKQKEDATEDKRKTVSVSEDESSMAVDGLIVDPNDYVKFNVDINSDFQKFVVYELENLTQSFIVNFSDVFNDIKRKAVDSQLMEQPDNTEEIDNTIVKFLTLLASIYKDRMNAGLKFWNVQNSDLYGLLLLLVEWKLTQFLPAMFDFLGSISTGVESASYAHAMFKLGTNKKDIGESNLFSWGKLFATLQFYSKHLHDISSDDEPPRIPAIEEDTLCNYLYLCQQVVQYSNEARMEIWAEPLLAAHASIVTMISCPTSTRFRAALYDLLAAFCSNWGGGINNVGKQIALEVWNTLEYSEMIIPNKVMVLEEPEPVVSTPTIPPSNDNTLFTGYNSIPTSAPSAPKPQPKRQYFLPVQPAGFLREFEEEKTREMYTETDSVLNFLASLIHTPTKRDELISGFSFIEPSIPQLLGRDNKRTPGTAPYVSLVIDHIFLNLKNQRYIYPSTRWRLADACLAFIENSILSFDIDPLVDYIRYVSADTKVTLNNYIDVLTGTRPAPETTPSSAVVQNALLAVITQPGYDILIRILSGGGLIHELFKIVEKGKATIPQNIKEDKDDYFKRCMTRCLRIFSKVFNVQNAFVNVIIPQLEISSTKQSMGQFKLGDYIFPSPPPSLRSLGNLMLNNTEVIVQIALMVNCDEYEDICELSTAVLAKLASQPRDDSVKFPNHINAPMGGIGSHLAGILLSSSSASSIIFNFSERLEIDSAEIITYDDYEYDINVIPFWLATETMNNIYRFNENNHINHTLSVRITILDMLLKNMSKEIKSPTVTEFLLGYDVKELEATGVQQKSIPTDVQHKSQLACFLSILDMLCKGTEQVKGSQHVESLIRTHPVLAEKCYQLLFQLCARESTSNATLHYLRNNTDSFLVQQFKTIACRLETSIPVSKPCFEGILISADKMTVPTDYFTLVSSLNQRAWLLKLIALELHLTAKKQGSTSALLELLYGCSDKPAVSSVDTLVSQMEDLQLQLDTNYQQPLWNMLEIVNSLDFTWTDGLSQSTPVSANYFKDFDENKYMIEKDGYNIYDIRNIYKILRQYQITDPSCLNLSESERIAVEMEMGSILQRLMAENRYREISHARLHCLRAWKQVVQVTISDCFDLLSFEAREKIIYDLLSVLLPKLELSNGLHTEILKDLAEVTLSLFTRLREDKRKQSILRVTSNATSESRLPDEKLRMIFNSIINCIQKEDSTIEVRSAIYSALVNLLQYIKPEDESEETVPGDIRTQVIEIIGSQNRGKLLDIICTDATKGLAMYKTTAYMALEVLYVLGNKSKSSVIHTYLVKKNFLQYTINMIKRSDTELTKVIEERDASLIALYNYEATISLFMQMALTKEGAALLLSNDLITNINHCKFINARFDHKQRADSDTAYKEERHARLLTPILELMNALLASIGSQIADQYCLKSWIKDQEVLVYILKDEKPTTTLTRLYLLQLTTSLLYQLSCQTHYFDDIENNGLEEIDSLMMSLIPKYCLDKDWATAIEAVGAEEIVLSKNFISDTVGGQVSLLAAKAEKHITHIRKNLLAYARTSTFRTYTPGKQLFKPIIANTLVPIKEQTSTSNKVSLMTPSLTTLVSCLSYAGKKMSKARADYQQLCAQKENVGSLKYEESHEIANTAIPKGLDIKFESLKPNQQFQLLATEINNRIKLKLKEIRDLMFIIENVLMILWRHLVFYLQSSSISTTTALSPCERYADEIVVLHRQMLFQTTPAVIERLKLACQQELEPVLQKLATIPLTSSIFSEISDRLRKCYI